MALKAKPFGRCTALTGQSFFYPIPGLSLPAVSSESTLSLQGYNGSASLTWRFLLCLKCNIVNSYEGILSFRLKQNKNPRFYLTYIIK
jgi:hypothetical protein